MSIDITVTGRLTKDPELRRTQSGKLVTNFGLAHNSRERAGNEFKDVVTVFFDASVWEDDGVNLIGQMTHVAETSAHYCICPSQTVFG
jgi:single-stranded DNA-binding protein